MFLQGAFCLAVLAVKALAQTTKTIIFSADLPQNYMLMKGDSVKIPLNEYVNFKGAQFSVNGSNQSYIQNMVSSGSTLALPGGTLMSNCDFMTQIGATLLMVCNSNTFVNININHQIKFINSNSTINLQAAGLNQNFQVCTDMLFDGQYVYVSCYDSNNPNGIYLFVINYGTMTLVDTRCPGPVYKRAKLVQLSYGAGLTSMGIFDSAPGTAVGGTTNFTMCFPSASLAINHSVSTSNVINLNILYPVTPINCTIRGVASLSSTEVVFVMANQSTNIGEIQILVANIDSNGQLTPGIYNNTRWFPGSMASKFFPLQLGAGLEVTQSGVLLTLADLQYMYVLNVTFNKLGAKGPVINFNQPSINAIDCGKASDGVDHYVSKITTFSRNPLMVEYDRKIIEYRSTTSFDVKDFAVHQYGSKYGCSKVALLGNPVKSILMLAYNSIIGMMGSSLVYFSVSHSSYLKINTNLLAAGNYSLAVTAQLPGFNPANTVFNFGLINNSSDYAAINFTTKSIRVFAGSKVTLPLSASSFFINNANYTVDVNNTGNTILNYAKTYYPQLPFSLPTGYTIHRIVAVDESTFIATLRRPTYPNQYITFFTQSTPGLFNITGYVNSSFLASGTNLFEVFKIGPNIYCIVFKSVNPDAKKLTLTCAQDWQGGQVLLNQVEITNQYEVNEIDFLRTSERVDLLMVGVSIDNGAAVSRILHFFVQVNNDGSLTTSSGVSVIATNHPAVNSYSIEDVVIEYNTDEEGSNKLVIKYNSLNGYPLLAKYNLTFIGDVPSLKYLRKVNVLTESFTYCPTAGETIVYSPKTMTVYSQPFDQLIGVAVKDQYSLSLKDYGIVKIDQFLCAAEKGVAHILGYDANKNRILLTLKGGNSWNAATRVHSVVTLDPTVQFISYSYGEDYLVVVGGSPGDLAVKRSFTLLYTGGPFVMIDNVNKTANYSLTITGNSGSASASDTIAVEVVNQTNSTAPKVVTQFPSIQQGTTINLETALNLSGPVMDIVINGDANGSFNLTKRNNQHKGFSTGDPTRPNKIMVRRDFIALLYARSVLRVYGDPTQAVAGSTGPVSILNITGTIRNFTMTRYGSGENGILCIKEFISGTYTFSLYLLLKTYDSAGKPIYSSTAFRGIYTTKDDYKDLHIAQISNVDVVISMRAPSKIATNNFKLLYIKYVNGNFVLSGAAAAIPPPGKSPNSFSLVDLNNSRVAIAACSRGQPGVMFAVWNLATSQTYFRETTKNVTLLDNSSVKLSIDFLKCYSAGTLKLNCIFHTSGTTDYMVEVTFDPMSDVTGEYISSMNQTGEFEMPLSWDVSKIERGTDNIALLISRNQAYKMFNNVTGSRRLLQQKVIDSLDTCNNAILIYRPKISKFVYTGITCSEWGNATGLDFAMEKFNGRDHVFFTLAGTALPYRRLLQGGNTTNNSVSSNYIANATLQVLNNNFDPAKVGISIVGFTGQASPLNQQVTLNSLQQPSTPPAASSNWWVWVLIILLILAVIGGGVAAYFYFAGKSGSSSRDSVYSAAPSQTEPESKKDPNTTI